jgi:hypothetical protein
VRLGKVSGERPRGGGDLTCGCQNRRNMPAGAADSDGRFERPRGAIWREKERGGGEVEGLYRGPKLGGGGRVSGMGRDRTARRDAVASQVS